ncbi:MAG: ATP-binding protein [Pseudomonadota bacterium]
MKEFLGRYLEFITRKQGLRVVTIVIMVLLVAAGSLSVLSARDMKEIINTDFNHQQLELARHAAGILTENFKILKRELLTLSLSPSIQYMEAVSWPQRMKTSLSSASDHGVIQISLIIPDGSTAYSINYTNATYVQRGAYDGEEFFQWCRKPESKSQIFISDVRKGIVEDSEPGFIMMMAMPVYQISSDEAHPTPTQQFSGVLVFVLDAVLLAKKVVGPIRSGKTGYAWVIDESGNFLYHLEKEFIGLNAFEVRRFKDPHISFSKINLIQKEKMLQGEEGTSWYVSGWHRGLTGQVKKLIAYAPVQIGGANTKRIWSVAVAAPTSEVEDAVHRVYVRQSLIQGVFIAAAVIILAVFIAMERVWLRTLEHVVQEKTSDLEQYAQRLRSSEERYRFLIESADDLIYTVDREGNILSVNQYYSRLTGKRDEDVIGRKLTDIIQYQNPENIGRIVNRVLESSKTIGNEERARIGDREYWLDTKYKPIITSGDQANAVLVISRDITEHKSMEAQLFHTEKLASLGSLSAGVAHEMNNPIAVILGFTEMLLEKFPEGSKEREILTVIERQGNNCKRIVENLLAFARLPQKTTTETDVVEDLQRVINVVMNTMLTKKVDLKTNIEEDLPKVRGDAQQLEQVFMNIINNAVAAMDGGGLLTISAHLFGDTVGVEFTDTGHGIPTEYMDKIFEPFFTTKKVGEGTGLGLSVSYGIVRKFGGDIRVRSQTADEGKTPGTTFTVSLALSEGKGSEV